MNKFPTHFFAKRAFLLSPLALAVSLTARAESVELDAVTVTADFRQSEIQALPEAVTVVGEAQIEQRNAEHLEQVLSYAPNVNFAAGSSRARFYHIRGIGERSQFIDPVNPSVGLMIDGIDMTGLGGAATLLDVDQVEILRGPQGTRFGANALAGMINIRSKAPTEETEGYVKGQLGNYGTHGQSGAVSGALTDNVQGRLAVSSFKTDGYMENDHLDRDNTNNIDEVVVRGKLAAQINADTDLNLTYFYTDIDNGYDAFSLDQNRTTYSDNPGVDAQESHSFALDLNSKLSDAVTFEAVLATSKADVNYSYDEDWAFGSYDSSSGNCIVAQGPCLATQDGAYGYSSLDQYLRKFQRNSLDLRLMSGENGKIFAGTTDWVVGLYAFNRDEDLSRSVFRTNTGENRADKRVKSTLKTTSYSVYGELSTIISDDLQLIYGARLEKWKPDYDDNRISDTDNDETLKGGKVTLEYMLNQNHMSYVSVARGYKAGGINTEPSLKAADRTYDTEYNNTIELGMKSSLLDDKLKTRVAAFYIQRKDQQVKQSFVEIDENNKPDFTDFIANAGKSRNQGIEIEGSWALSPQLQWDFSAGYLDAEFDEYQFNAKDKKDPAKIIVKDGRKQAHAPEYTAATALAYQFMPAMTFTVESEAKDKFFFSDSHDNESKPYVLWHARLAYEVEQYAVALYGRNLTAQRVETRGFGFGNDPRDNYANTHWTQLGEPRLVGIEGKYSF
ncbi:TonB-dependent receptor [Bacterioplanoides sp.]|uniref:TonB-dependent receptor n=1 Tax=Bacterioplanoides sp. TaxID=2066072 RepID=UPI003B58C9F5